MGVWIEIANISTNCLDNFVTPCVGVWIEISDTGSTGKKQSSLPAWECGLKLEKSGLPHMSFHVTPCVGVWIEIACFPTATQLIKVTPCVGVWIEICRIPHIACVKTGHSLRGSVD